jgi:hypothetical protein
VICAVPSVLPKGMDFTMVEGKWHIGEHGHQIGNGERRFTHVVPRQ